MYVALQRGLNRRVALKIPHDIENESMLNRFIREGETLARLSHPNIVRVYDAGIEKGVAFMAMELIEGQDLKHYLEDQTPSIEQTVGWGIALADALDYIHSRDVIHRDIKSLNVIINKENQPVLVDFGIARDEEMPQLTQKDRLFFGSLRYSGPELFDDASPGEQSDIYSLGVVLYRCLSGGKYPYDADTARKFIASLERSDHAPLCSIREEVPGWLSDVLDYCLDKNPATRMANGAVLRGALQQGLRLLTSEPDDTGQPMLLNKPKHGIAHMPMGMAGIHEDVEIIDESGSEPATPSGRTRTMMILAAIGVVLVAWVVWNPLGLSHWGTTTEQKSLADQPPPSVEQVEVPSIPAQIDSLMSARTVEALESKLIDFRNKAVLTYDSKKHQFTHPETCYIVVYNASGTATVLGPEDEQGSRLNLRSGERVPSPFEVAFQGHAFLWVALLG